MTKDKNNTAGNNSLFGKQNYLLMLAGLAVLALGFFLMAGGKSSDPNQFNANEVYSATRITIAPILIMAGFVIEIIAIMRKPKQD
ncbi:MAG: DUF3098 domain-containing protein [Ferruginibacter sp.]|jgi:hypothetical protein